MKPNVNRRSLLPTKHPLLSRIATEIIQPTAQQDLIEQLMQTMFEHQGVGIAAPQVGESIRLFILSSHPNERYPHAPKMEPMAIINPVILDHNQEQAMGWEGCLSVPGQRGLVPRFTEIEVQYIDRWGQCQQQIFTDFIARVFQHEMDHLNGILFPQRVLSPMDLITEAEYQVRQQQNP